MIASLPAPQRYIVGSFLFLAGVAFAVAPLPLALRSAGILLCAYLSFAAAGSSAAFTTGLLLAVATFWGFLTTFGVAPAVPMWTAVPVWCLGLGLGHFIGKVRGL